MLFKLILLLYLMFFFYGLDKYDNNHKTSQNLFEIKLLNIFVATNTVILERQEEKRSTRYLLRFVIKNNSKLLTELPKEFYSMGFKENFDNSLCKPFEIISLKRKSNTETIIEWNYSEVVRNECG